MEIEIGKIGINNLIFEIKCVINKCMKNYKIKIIKGQIVKLISPLNNHVLAKVGIRKGRSDE